MKEIQITENADNQRLDRFLFKLLPHASKGFIQKMLRKKNIKLNQSKAEPARLLKKGDAIQIYFSDETYNQFAGTPKKTAQKPPLTFDSPLEIISESPDLLVVSKPAGLLTQPDQGKESTLIDQVLDYLIRTDAYNPDTALTFRPACSNRLDRNTSGIILIPKNYHTLQSVNKAIREHQVKKYYLTLVEGITKSNGVCRHYFNKERDKNIARISDAKTLPDQKPVELLFKRLDTKNNTSLLAVNLLTGRSHQIRAQLAHQGHSILGDPKYGNLSLNTRLKQEYQLNSQLLHSFSYSIPDRQLSFRAPLPKKFLKVASGLGYDLNFLKEAGNGILE